MRKTLLFICVFILCLSSINVVFADEVIDEFYNAPYNVPYLVEITKAYSQILGYYTTTDWLQSELSRGIITECVMLYDAAFLGIISSIKDIDFNNSIVAEKDDIIIIYAKKGDEVLESWVIPGECPCVMYERRFCDYDEAFISDTLTDLNNSGYVTYLNTDDGLLSATLVIYLYSDRVVNKDY